MKNQRGGMQFQICRSKGNNRSNRREVEIKIDLIYIRISFTPHSSTYYDLVKYNISLVYQRWIKTTKQMVYGESERRNKLICILMVVRLDSII
jgi:hypothetical protein